MTLAATLVSELWLVDLSQTELALEGSEKAARRLSVADLDRIQQFAGIEQRRERRLSYLALRVLIERHFGAQWRGVAFQRGPNGKPSLPGLSGDFSLAHAGGLAFIGVAGAGRIGVDLETLRHPAIPEARRLKMETVAAALAPEQPLPASQPGRFLAAWARLEALGKADGRGVGYVLGALGAWGRQRETDETSDAPFEGAYRVASISAGDGLFAAAAVSAGEPQLLGLNRFPVDAAGLARLLMPH